MFASLYDSVDSVRTPGMRKGAALNIMRAGDVVRLDVVCRRMAGEGDDGYLLCFDIQRIHWILDAPRKYLLK